MSAYDPSAYDQSGMFGSDPSQLPMVRYARWAMIILAIVQLLSALVVGSGFIMFAVMEDRPDDELIGFLVAGTCMPIFMVGLGALPAAIAAFGLGRGTKWGWGATILVGILNIFPCCTCLPLGAFLLFAMLNEETRAAFEDR